MGVNRAQPRYRALAEVLRIDLQAGRYPVGSVLPGELELVDRHRVSRHTVREALRCLEEQGLITRNRGIGTVVTALESPPGHVQRLASPAEWMRYPEGSRLVVLATEFGRTPRINANLGRDHYPKAFSAAVFGGGFKAGYAHGGTDATGEEVVTGALGIPDFNATLALALGLPVDQVVFSPSRRPFRLADKGAPVTALLA